MKQKRIFLILALLCTMVQAAWADDDEVVGINYIERAWDGNTVTQTEKTCTSYIVINGTDTDAWMGLYNGWYVVTGDTHYKTLDILGNDVHLIIPDGVTLAVDGGVKLESGYTLNIYSQERDFGVLIANQSYTNAAGIGSGGGSDDPNAGTLIVHGGKIWAKGNNYGAGIGGGYKQGFGTNGTQGGLIVYGGDVEAYGDVGGAGIGSGYECPDFAGYVTIYGGTVNATGGYKSPAFIGYGYNGAGIGGGDGSPGAIVHIWGGTVNAYGATYAAAIGGGFNGRGIKTHIHDGTVTAVTKSGAAIGGGNGEVDGGEIIIDAGTVVANAEELGAGIGCGRDGISATITISGGTVTATNGTGGAGIGGGYNSQPNLNINISGGTVTATGLTGIGSGQYEGGSKTLDFVGTLNITGGKVYAFGTNSAIGGSNVVGCMNIYDSASVRYGNSVEPTSLSTAADRKSVCVNNKCAFIEPCVHSGATYTVSGTSSTDSHTMHCNYCNTAFTPETHTFSNGKCTVCGVEQTAYIVTVNVPANNGAVDGVYEARTYQMVPNTTFKLPASPVTFSDRVFAGWLLGTAQNHSYTAREGDDLHAAGEEYTITGDVTFTARYSYVYIQLADNADNSETLYKYTGINARIVRLADRTLYKDGSWNTLCLPFDVTTESGTLSGDNVQAMTLDTETSNLTDGTLTLNFTEAETIPAGTPFIIKWDNTGNNIVTPEFGRVTIDAEKHDAAIEDVLTFSGTYAPVSIGSEGDNTKLFIGANNELYYPNADMTIGCQRAYFQLAEGLTADEPVSGSNAKQIRAFILNFGDDKTTDISTTKSETRNNADGWYSIDGRRLHGKPTQRGIYINNGQKVVIK